ncbi:hypothetical protein MKX03_015886, partial [Papaver bracteatum]
SIANLLHKMRTTTTYHVHADWRSFRAKLVSRERSSKPSGTSNLMMNHKPVEQYHAHVCLLIATEQLDGINILKRTVILILSIDSKFSMGIILNKRSSMTISIVTDKIYGPLYFGRPLDEKLVLAMRSGFFEEVIEGLYYRTNQESLCYLDEMWTNKILRDEIRIGHWEVIACSPDTLSPLNSEESKHSYGNT